MFIRTTAIDKILVLDKFTRGVQGGTSAGKTFGILPVLIDYATKSKVDISVVSESIPHLKRGAMKDFKDIMLITGRWIDSHWNASDFKYTFGGTRSQIEFFSATDDSKLRGARRDWLYMNECNNVNFHAYTELASRTKKGVFLDWNPVDHFWFHEELMSDPDVDYITINYLDNEACPESAKNFILKAKEKAAKSAFWDNWYKVYGLGEIGNLQGSVFDNWAVCDNIPRDAEYIATGLDFGFTNDPTAIVDVYRFDKELYIRELLYQKRLTNSDIAARFPSIGITPESDIIADSAEPKSIEDLSRSGYQVTPAKKGPDSIISSIDTLQQFKINVTSDSTNLIKELRGYKWLTDKSGKSLNSPVDFNNHLIDALRYVASNRIGKDEMMDVY